MPLKAKDAFLEYFVAKRTAGVEEIAHSSDLQRVLNAFLLRRTLAAASIKLPPKDEFILPTALTQLQIDW